QTLDNPTTITTHQHLTTTLAHLHTHGTPINWNTLLQGATHTDLPTYPFQRRRYWLDAPPPVRPSGSGNGHPLLDGVVELAAPGGALFTGRLSEASHGWLADHTVLGTVTVPGSALVDMALQGGGVLEELTLDAPLVLSGDGGIDLQVAVGVADEASRRAVSVHARPVGGAEPWVCHARGVLGTAAQIGGDRPDASGWRPGDGVPVDVDALYGELSERGLEYGPSFRTLRRAWRHGADLVFAEVALPEGLDATGFALHPSLLDGALHAIASDGDGRRAQVPFAWDGVSVSDALRPVRSALVRITRSGPGRWELDFVDEERRPVAGVRGLVVRPLAAVAPDALFGLRWVPAPAVLGEAGPPWVLFDGAGRAPTALAGARRVAELPVAADGPLVVFAPVGGGGTVAASAVPGQPVARAHELTREVLALLGSWRSAGRSPDARLVVVTGGVAGDAPDPAAAAVWGLLRSAQAEDPGCVTLLDLDDGAGADAVAAALATGEPQVAVRGAEVLVPRLMPERPEGEPDGGALDPAGTVLVTGATGALGAVVARHLVAEHGVRRLLLTGRRAVDRALVAELTAAGAEVATRSCDMADRAAVEELLAAVPAGHPLTAVVHTAGVRDDGVVGVLTPERLSAVLRPKVDAAWHLHELIGPRCSLVLFSSLAGVVGTAGQAAYAAGNAFLDALAQARRAAGLPGVSMAWGPWAETGMAESLGAADTARLARTGVLAVSREEGLGLFDAVLAARAAAVVAPVRWDRAVLADRLADGGLAPVLRGLVRSAPRGGEQPSGDDVLRRTLVGLAPPARRSALLELVRTTAAEVLGHSSTALVAAERGFTDLGVDSLMAVELRNRLNGAVGVRLPSSAVFDHPTPARLAEQLAEEIGAAEGAPKDASLLAELERMEAVFAAAQDPGVSEGARSRVAARLSRLLAVLEPHGGPAGSYADGADGADETDSSLLSRMDDASDEDIFAFIDEELGSD
ncbi:SDR family NAD(P)-dependent oxidoreductase, partial [Streptomyces sp. NPDC001123]